MFNCACAYEFRKVRIRGTQRFYFVGAILFCDNVQTHLGGVSVREGASNRDITVVSVPWSSNYIMAGHAIVVVKDINLLFYHGNAVIMIL